MTCSEFWGPSVISDQGMRVNCDVSAGLNSKVKIMSRQDDGLSISEIEVHTIGKFCKNNDITISRLSYHLYHLNHQANLLKNPYVLEAAFQNLVKIWDTSRRQCLPLANNFVHLTLYFLESRLANFISMQLIILKI